MCIVEFIFKLYLGIYNWFIVSINYVKVPEAYQDLIDNVERTMKHAIEEEEKVPLSQVVNFRRVSDIKTL